MSTIVKLILKILKARKKKNSCEVKYFPRLETLKSPSEKLLEYRTHMSEANYFFPKF